MEEMQLDLRKTNKKQFAEVASSERMRNFADCCTALVEFGRKVAWQN